MADMMLEFFRHACPGAGVGCVPLWVAAAPSFPWGSI